MNQHPGITKKITSTLLAISAVTALGFTAACSDSEDEDEETGSSQTEDTGSDSEDSDN